MFTASYDDDVVAGDGRWLLLADNLGIEKRLYDTRRDPGEQVDVASRRPGAVRRLWDAVLDDAGRHAAAVRPHRRDLRDERGARRRASPAAGCSRPAARRPRAWPRSGALGSARAGRARRGQNVIVIVLDNVRADHVGAYGGRRVRTPAIDGLARESLLLHAASAPRCFPRSRPAARS